MSDALPPETPVPEGETGSTLRAKRATVAMRMALNFILHPPESREAHASNIARDLGEEDRIRLLWLLMDTFPPHIAEQAAQTFFEGAGYPGVSLMADCKAEAKLWAADANPQEVDIYARACFNRMPPQRRALFLEWAKGGTK